MSKIKIFLKKNNFLSSSMRTLKTCFLPHAKVESCEPVSNLAKIFCLYPFKISKNQVKKMKIKTDFTIIISFTLNTTTVVLMRLY
jgi:hypothetical protein